MKTPWDLFFEAKIKHIFEESKTVVDIGGGLRISKTRGNRFDKKREWILPLLKKTEYKIMDPVSDYDPDILGDIHNMPFNERSQDAILCLAVLEHIENPFRASDEIYRVLKNGGYCFVYLPFLYYYHAYPGYYNDYWRYTEDSINLLFKRFKTIEITSVRGALETWLHISPLGRVKFLVLLFRWLDRITGKDRSKQVSGYFVFLQK